MTAKLAYFCFYNCYQCLFYYIIIHAFTSLFAATTNAFFLLLLMHMPVRWTALYLVMHFIERCTIVVVYTPERQFSLIQTFRLQQLKIKENWKEDKFYQLRPACTLFCLWCLKWQNMSEYSHIPRVLQMHQSCICLIRLFPHRARS